MTMSDNAQGCPPGMNFLAMMQRTMDAFAKAWQCGNIEGLMALVSEDPLYRTSGGAVFAGRENVRNGFAQICKPSAGNTLAAKPPRLHFFDNKCVSYWTLALPSQDGTPTTVEGVDIITFDEAAKILCKDAYRKLA